MYLRRFFMKQGLKLGKHLYLTSIGPLLHGAIKRLQPYLEKKKEVRKMKAYLVGKYEHDLQDIPCKACPVLQEFKLSITDEAQTADIVLCPSTTTVGFYSFGKIAPDA